MTKSACFVLACIWMGAVQEPPAAPAAKPKPTAREYVLTVVLVKADGTAVEGAQVRVSYGGEGQTKPANTGTVIFRFKTAAGEALVHVNAPGMVIYNKSQPLTQEKIEHRAELEPSE